MGKKLSVLLIFALLLSWLQPAWSVQQAQASSDVTVYANKDVFIDVGATYPSGLDAFTFVPGAGHVNVNVVGPDFDGGIQKTAINFTGLNSGLPATITSVKLRVFVPFIYANSGTTPNDIRVTVDASSNTSWPEGLTSNNPANFPADNNDSLLNIASLQSVRVATNTGVIDSTNVDTTSPGCTPIAGTLLGCLYFDVTDYVTNKITGGATDITFLLTGRSDANKTAYFTVYPDENATYKPQLIFAGAADTTPPVVTGVSEGGLYNVDKTITYDEGTATLNGSAFSSGSTVSAENTYTLIVTDAASNVTTVHFTIDKTAPTISGATNGSTYNSNRTITISDGTATLDGSAFTSGNTVTTEGSHSVTATDTAGNSRTVTFTIDKTAPIVTGVTNGSTYNTSKTITFNEGTATLDGSAFSSGSSVSAEGSHTLIVTDTATNSTTVSFTIDTTAPTVTGAVNGVSYNSDRTITLSDGTATLDGSAFTSGSTVSAEGSHTLVATDAVGNNRTVTFTIDKTAPIVSGVTDTGLYNTNPTITFNEGTATLDGSAFTSGSTVSAESAHTLVVTDAAGNTTTVNFTIDKTGPVITGAANGNSYNSDRTITLSDGTATLDGSAFTSGSTVSAEGSHTLIATDTAGNTTTITFTIDKTAPIVTGVTDTGLYNTNQTVSFNEGTATLDGSAFTSGSTVSAENAHTLIVTDAAGNTTTVNFTIDKTGPVITGAANGSSYNSDRTITLSDGTATLDGSAFTSGSTVSAEGSHTLIATDAAGNTTTITFTIDKTAPIVTGVTDTGLYNTNQTVSFNEGTATLDGSAFTSGSTVSAESAHTLVVTDAAGNTTTVNFTIDKTGPVITGAANGNSYNSDRTITLSDGTATLDGSAFTSGSTVSAEGSHTLIATDAAGNTTTITFTIDKTAPIVTGVTDTGLYTLDKTITFNEGTATLDGSAFTSGSTVSAESAHTLIVTDAAGNTTTVNFTIDKTGPVITGAANGNSYNSDRTVTLSDGTATLDGSAFTSGSTVSAEGSHTLIATDAAGNTTTITFTIDKTAPIVTGVTDTGFYTVDKTITFNEGTATLDGSAFTSGSTVSAESAHTLVVTDAAGNTTTVNFTIDKTGPVITGAANGNSYNSNRTITLSDGTATLDGSAFTSGSTVSAEGSHTLIATDAAGNTTTITFTIDKTAPIVTGVTDTGLYNTDKTVTFNEGTATLDGSVFTSGSTVSAESAHTLVVTDAAGNTTTVNFTIDKTGPTVTGAANSGSYNSDRTITLSDGTATLDGSAFTSGSTVSAEGSHTLIATDAAGNTTTITFMIDKTAPIVTGVTDTGLYTVDKTITFNEGTATLDGSASTSGSTVSAEGAHTLIVTDAAGNATTINFTIDKTAPVVTGASDNASYTADRVITFNEGTATLDGSVFTSGSTVSAEGTHTLIVTDAAGNSTTVHFILDKTAPTGTIAINNGDATTKHKDVTLTITATDGSGVGGIQARFSDNNLGWTAWASVPSTLDWTLPNGKGTKTVYMQLKDSLGNVSSSISDTIVFKSLPELGNLTKNGQDGQKLTLSAGFFVYTNEDEGALQKIKLVSLPDHGTIKLNNVEVTVGQEVSLIDINNLVYWPQNGWSGTTQLVWNGSDGEVYSDHNGTLSFQWKSSSGPIIRYLSELQDSVQVIVNGVVQEQLATAKTETTADGRKSSTITIDEQKMNAKLEKEGNHSTVTIPFTKDTDQVFGVLNGQMVKNMENRDSILQIQTNNATYTIPAGQIKIDAVSKALDGSVALKDIEVKVEITKLSESDPAVTVQKQKNGKVAIIAPAIEFKLTGSYNGKQVEVSQFNAYVERTIAIPDGVDPNKITTGVVAMPDGTFVHVPTKVIQKDGKYYAVINSLTNSIYSVIYNEKSFADVENHWSKDVVDEMGARLVINGVDDTHFAPDLAITRAEFTAVIVRALGLREAHQNIAFADVTNNDWFYTSVAIGQEYGLIQGYSESEFGPSKLITRQEAMVIMQRALKLAGHTDGLSDEQISAQLDSFSDSGQFADWAKNAAALCMQLNIVEGSDGLARPSSNITRAETAAIIKRMLEAANLI